MDNFKNLFVSRLKEARNYAGLTQAELSEKSGVPQSTLAAYESKNKATLPDAENLVKIADAVGKSIDWLCGKDGDDKPAESEKEITSEQWLVRLFQMDRRPRTGIIEDPETDVDGDPYDEPDDEPDIELTELPIVNLEVPVAWRTNYGKPAAALCFYGSEMEDFFSAYGQYREFRRRIAVNKNLCLEIEKSLIKNYAPLFDPNPF